MKEERFGEIDAVRGIAVTLMVAYHVIFDLYMLDLVSIPIGSNYLELFADATAGTFFTIVGISLYLSFVRTKESKEFLKSLRKYLFRGAKIFFWGMAVTVVTFLLFPDLVVLFGALQFIGSSVIIAYLIIEFTYRWERKSRLIFLTFILSVFVFSSGYLRGINVDHILLIWVGIIPSGFQSLDYFPLFPWFSCVLGGLVLGELLYPEGKRRLKAYSFRLPPAEFLGRHALIFYLAHQPIIYLGVLIFKLPGYYLAAGFSGHGYMMAPSVGEGLADTILGENSDLPLGYYDPERIERGELREGALQMG